LPWFGRNAVSEHAEALSLLRRRRERPRSRAAEERDEVAPPNHSTNRSNARGFPGAEQERHSRRGAPEGATLSLEGVAGRITCPIYIMNGKLDRIVPPGDAERLAREAKGPVVLNLVEDGNHIANNRAYRWRSQSADWLAEQLRAG
jgi:pimeloyl-ACP methyl ester carboxylesterase